FSPRCLRATRPLARAICVAGAVLARLLRLVSTCDQANRLLDPVLGAGLSFLCPEAPCKKKAASSQGLFGVAGLAWLTHTFGFPGIAGCRTTGQTQTDGNIAAAT